MRKGSIVVLDFGGQYAHLIASRIRRFGVYAEIMPPETPASAFKSAAGIVLSGGPQSVYEPDSPEADERIFELGIPVLGLCYGLHWMTKVLGGDVSPGKVKEYGKTPIRIVEGGGNLLRDCGDGCTVWMSHGDEASNLPEGFSLIATSDACINAAFADESRHFYALQFHPEVTHTEHGLDMLRRFVDLCDADPWSIKSYAEHIGADIRREVGDRKVFMLVSGGVDSSVAFVLLNAVLGTERVQGLLVDHGLMRKNETSMIREAFEKLNVTNLHIEDASEEFLANLKGVYDPEEKRRIIGETFLVVQKRVSDEMHLRMEDGWMLGQGTIYPDTIETGSTKHADKIKTHHNRVEAVEKMIEAGMVVEPLKDLYKDEVRLMGEELGLPRELVWRHPFPGPGLGVRILCAEQPEAVGDDEIIDIMQPHSVLPVKSVGVQGDGRTYRHAVALFSHEPCRFDDEDWNVATRIPNTHASLSRVLRCLSHRKPVETTFSSGYIDRRRADLLREADHIVTEAIRNTDLYGTIWQFPVVLLPFGTKEGGQSIVLRPIASTDAMTANAVWLPEDILSEMVEAIMNIDGIDMVFLDMTNKPPATIEWE